jgi:hypothetical protein
MSHKSAHSFAPTSHGDVPTWVNDYFRHVAEEIRELAILLVKEPQHVAPVRLFDGLIEFADGTDWDPGRGRGLYIWTEEPAPGEWNYLESFSVNRAGFGVNWRNVWTQDLYYKGDMVKDGEWTMIANKDTTDRPAPQPNGDSTTSLPDVPVWDAIDQTVATVSSGQTYTFTVDGWVGGLRVWAPEVAAGDYTFRVVIIDSTNPQVLTRTISDPILSEDVWTILGLTNEIVRSGTILTIIIEALNSGASTQVTGGWARGAADNNNPPATGNWNHSTQQTILRIDNTDLDTADRSTELLGIILNSSIRFVDTLNPGNFLEYRVTAPPIDQITYVEYIVTVIDAGGIIAVLDATTMTATIPTADSTRYRKLTNQWVAGEPTWATVEGVLQYDGVTQPGNTDNAFGVDINFQPALVSADWDLVALSTT